MLGAVGLPLSFPLFSALLKIHITQAHPHLQYLLVSGYKLGDTTIFNLCTIFSDIKKISVKISKPSQFAPYPGKLTERKDGKEEERKRRSEEREQ